jgi:NAD(P)H-dependent FMN reductase
LGVFLVTSFGNIPLNELLENLDFYICIQFILTFLTCKMTHILAFGASSSKRSMNKALATYTANNIPNVKVTVIDLNDYEMPIYSIDREEKEGIPELAIQFKELIKNSDGIIISFAEHNGVYTTAFKNIFDWISRIEKVVWCDKPMLLMATSPGGHGGKSVLEVAHQRFSRENSNEIPTFSLPSFNQNFNPEIGITKPELAKDFDTAVTSFIDQL